MKKIDFRKLKVYTSIRKDEVKEMDAAYLIANTIYTNMGGVMAHSLAMRIYEKGEVELNEKEEEMLVKLADGFAGVLADSIKDNMK